MDAGSGAWGDRPVGQRRAPAGGLSVWTPDRALGGTDLPARASDFVLRNRRPGTAPGPEETAAVAVGQIPTDLFEELKELVVAHPLGHL